MELFSNAKKLQSAKNLQKLEILSMKTIIKNFARLFTSLESLGIYIVQSKNSYFTHFNIFYSCSSKKFIPGTSLATHGAEKKHSSEFGAEILAGQKSSKPENEKV